MKITFSRAAVRGLYGLRDILAEENPGIAKPDVVLAATQRVADQDSGQVATLSVRGLTGDEVDALGAASLKVDTSEEVRDVLLGYDAFPDARRLRPLRSLHALLKKQSA
mgnify:FL=1